MDSAKWYYVKDSIGKVPYTVSFRDGEKRHDDGSPFYDLRCFSRKRERDRFVRGLCADGYRYGTAP